ncbi:unnamed protein product [Merluccius merluccius]
MCRVHVPHPPRCPAAIQPSRPVARPPGVPRLCLKCQPSEVCREPALATPQPQGSDGRRMRPFAQKAPTRTG